MVVRIIQNLIRNSVTHSDGQIAIELKESNEFVTMLFSNPIDVTAYNDAFDPNVFFERFYSADKTRILGYRLFHIELRKKLQQ